MTPGDSSASGTLSGVRGGPVEGLSFSAGTDDGGGPDPSNSRAAPSGPSAPYAPARTPAWEAALFSLIHPLQVAVVEACLWIDEPLSSSLLVDLFDESHDLNTVAYHVRRLARRGVLHLHYSRPVRGALEHFYQLEPPVGEPLSPLPGPPWRAG